MAVAEFAQHSDIWNAMISAMQNLLAGVILATLPTGGILTSPKPQPNSYLFVWAGDSARKSSDFLAVIDADPASPSYGRVLATVATGAIGTPHHTEATVAADGHLLANDFTLGRTWLFDVSQPRHPRVLAEFGDVGGFSHPHTFARLANGNVLATFQYRVDETRVPSDSAATGMRGMPNMKMESPTAPHVTGGLVEMNERGRVIMERSAVDPVVRDKLLYPYSVLPMPAMDRAVSTTTDMNLADSASTAEWVQFWRLSDLKLLRSVALSPGPRGDENKYTGEPRLLEDGHSVYIHTFNCGLYLVQDIGSPQPVAKFVYGFKGVDCGVPIQASHYWLQTVPQSHALVALDIRDPAHPREVSRVMFGNDEFPHWVAIDRAGRRVVLNSAGHGSRLFVINFDPRNGALAIDQKFRDADSTHPGVSMSGRSWPGGFNGTAIPHGSVFSN